MVVMMLQLIFVLSILISTTVSSDVLRWVGDSVNLDIQHPAPEFDELSWVFNRTENVLTNNVLKYYTEGKKTKQYPAYEGRVEFNKETYSLTLKNLQKNDSGLYEARASGDENRVVAEYRLSVLVSSDVLRWVGDSVNLDIQHPAPEFDELSWVFNRTENVLTNNVLKYYTEGKKTKQYPAYEGRVEFNEETYSLTLKNLQKNDSGLYEVRASGDENRVVAEYRLSVLDAASSLLVHLCVC
ncbi:uncharacterized protein LOC118797552 [Colossoma macropomum]|uniref:uncharacterized protein LOC118797552 n=1 Tax=Colossoma macropomum TaxID=42526 RepID=UPI0018647D06|nr:uncharacterized protein LOC118797552 [Colossoma macropomum]